MQLIEWKYKTTELIKQCILNNWTYVWCNNKACKKAHHIAIQMWYSNLKTKTRENSGNIIWQYVVDDFDKILPWCMMIAK